MSLFLCFTSECITEKQRDSHSRMNIVPRARKGSFAHQFKAGGYFTVGFILMASCTASISHSVGHSTKPKQRTPRQEKLSWTVQSTELWNWKISQRIRLWNLFQNVYQILSGVPLECKLRETIIRDTMQKWTKTGKAIGAVGSKNQSCKWKEK